MRNLLKYLKPFWWIILLVIGFTFTQVQMELALPDYMSDIVTNGIQYGGIKDNVAKAISKDKMDEVLFFLDDDEQLRVLNSYTLYESGTEGRIDNQVIEFKEDLYLLNENYDAELNRLLMKPLVYASVLEENDLSLNKDELIAKLDEKIESYSDNLASVAIMCVQAEYDSIGLNIETIQSNYILHQGLMMLLISLIGAAAQITSTYLATKVATHLAYNLRKDVFAKVESFSSAEFSKFSTSSLITRTTNDIQQIQNMVQMMLRMFLMAPMMGLTSVFKVMRYPDLLWILLVAIGVIICLMLITLFVAMPRFKKIQSLIDKMNNVMREFLDGMLVIRAFNSQKHEEERFDDANHTLAKTNLFVDRTMATVMPFMNLTMNFVTVAIIWFGSTQIDMNVMSVGEMMAFIQYATHVLMSFMIVAMIWVMIPRALVSVGRVFDVLNMENSILDPEVAETLPKEATLRFENVSFKYPHAEEYVLENINFEVKPGETIALIGSTGSGKSTIIKLIPRLFDVTEGAIYYGEHDIRAYNQKDLRDQIGFVSQKAVLFTGDIEENIRFGRDVSDAQLEKAIEVSQSKTIIEEKEEGLKSKITQGGTNVSGGQKQRLSIARALASDAKIYIFDDSFSALDYATDKRLRSALKDMVLKSKSIVFIVAQRISTIKDADRIIVLDDGKVVGNGSHAELLKGCKVYGEIARSQLSEEELANAA